MNLGMTIVVHGMRSLMNSSGNVEREVKKGVLADDLGIIFVLLVPVGGNQVPYSKSASRADFINAFPFK